MSPIEAIESKCFAENWIGATIPQEINNNSISIYPTHEIIISPDRRKDGLSSDIKLHSEKCLSKAAVPKQTQNPWKNLRNLKNIAFIEFSSVSGQNTFILSELTQYYSRYQPKCKNSI